MTNQLTDWWKIPPHEWECYKKARAGISCNHLLSERCGFGACNRTREAHAPYVEGGTNRPYITGHHFTPQPTPPADEALADGFIEWLDQDFGEITGGLHLVRERVLAILADRDRLRAALEVSKDFIGAVQAYARMNRADPHAPGPMEQKAAVVIAVIAAALAARTEGR